MKLSKISNEKKKITSNDDRERVEPECLGREGEQRACGRDGVHEREGGVSVVWKGE